MRITRKIYWSVMGTFVVIFMIGAQIKVESIAVPAFLGAIGWWFFGGILTRLIGAMFVTALRCPNCGLEVPAVQQWQVGSYTDHRERHVLMAKSPLDGARVGHLPCPQCSATILV